MFNVFFSVNDIALLRLETPVKRKQVDLIIKHKFNYQPYKSLNSNLAIVRKFIKMKWHEGKEALIFKKNIFVLPLFSQLNNFLTTYCFEKKF